MIVNLHTYEGNKGPLKTTQMDENWKLIQNELMELKKLTEESLNKKTKTVTMLQSQSKHITAKIEEGFIHIANLKINQMCKLTLDLFTHVDIETLQIKYSESEEAASPAQNEIIATNKFVYLEGPENNLEQKEYISYES